MTDEPEDAPRKMLTIDEVLAIVPVSRATLHRMEARGRFPRGRVITGRRRIWFADEIAAWQRRLIQTNVRRVA